MTSKAVANPTKGQLAVMDYGDAAGEGVDALGREDFSIPLLDIIQSNSGEMTQEDSDFKAGMLVSRVLGEAFDGKKGVSVIPCGRDHKFVEWKPKDQGGGIVHQYDPSDEVVQKLRRVYGVGKMKMDGQPITKDNKSNDLVETFYVPALVGVYGEGKENFEIERWLQLIIPYASTKISAYKGMMTKVGQLMVPGPGGSRVRPPIFARRYRHATKLNEKNGNKWFSYDVTLDLGETNGFILPGSPEFEQAREFARAWREGLIKMDTTGADGPSEGTSTGSAPISNAEDIPF